MAQFEQYEGQQHAEAKGLSAPLSSYVLDRQDPSLNSRELQIKSNDMVAQNVLPELSINHADVTPGYGNRHASRAELKEAGIKMEQKAGQDGIINTKVEFPNGVKVVKSEMPERNIPGTDLKTKGSTTAVIGASEKPVGSGEYFDKSGKQVARVNADKSVTVDGGDGKFYTVEKDGTVTKASALRSRDGKKFQVIDTDSPLGGYKK